MREQQVEIDHEPKASTKNSILYKIQEKPPSFLSFFLGFQQYLTMIGGCVAYPYVVANIVCMRPDDMNKV